MRTYGEIAGVSFSRLGFSIYTLGIEYRLCVPGENKVVSVSNMRELKQEISQFIREQRHDQSEI